ncbi:efflux RND transporter permease subunit [Bacteroides thetaiotaomicron]|uniref:efflux RND transporter permease subunit n=1 Tax=Bacteroides thetaiotaomicron TaxID=818 RepID=UPI0018AA5CDE|nr:efflux RND transporter permease subunit [Bacteroides thetaiotaomicron]MDC2163642.1 efflux RND transporter permease subunit [Bacteroides thetaiotaomicron]
MDISNYFIKRPTLFWSLMAIIVIGGIYCYIKMPKLEDPAVGVKEAIVVTQFPGASAHEVELQVTSVLESELRALPEIKKITSESSDGMSKINVTLQDNVFQDIIQQRWDLLRRKVESAAVRLPRGCAAPIVMDDVADVYGMFYAVTSTDYGYPDMWKWTDFIKRELLALPGVRRIEIKGDPQQCIDITLTKEQVDRNGYLPTMIMGGINNATSAIPAGSYQTMDQEVSYRVDGKVESEEEFENLLLKTIDKKQIRLGDIADVKRTISEPQTGGIWVNNKPALGLMITAEDNVNVVNVGDAVEKRLEELKKDIPAGFEIEKIYFQPKLVKAATNGFMINLVESVLIVVLVLMFTMGLRPSLIIGAGLILTIAASFPFLLCFGTTMQRISLGAFIVAMGMLVDNAIVIMDGILVDKAKGLPPKRYLFNICKKTAIPLLGATAIASVTFIEVFLAKNSASEYASDLFLVITISLLLSWVLALTQVPMFSKLFLPARYRKPDLPEGKKTLGDRINNKMKAFITLTVNHKYVTTGVAIGLFVVACWGMRFVKNLFFPDGDYNQFVVEYQLPAGTSADKVNQDMHDITEELLRNPEIHNVFTFQGGAPARYCLLRPMNGGGSTYGEFLIDCEDYDAICRVIPQVRKHIRENHPEAYVRLRKYNFSIQTSHTVEVQFTGPDPAILKELSAKAEAIMRRNPFIDSLSVSNDWKFNTKALFARFNQQNAYSIGIERSDVGKSLQAAGLGLTAGALYENNRIVPVYLKVRNTDGSRITDVTNIPVFSAMPNIQLDNNDISGVVGGSIDAADIQDKMYRSVPLAVVTDNVELGWEEGVVRHYDGQRAIEAQADPDMDMGYTSNNAYEYMREDIENISLPDGYKMKWLGEKMSQGESKDKILDFVPLIMVCILVILLLLFGSWKKVIVIISCLPFVLIGISPALIVSQRPFTFLAIIGILGLIGMMVKNAIVLVDEVTRLTKEKTPSYEALITATVSRIRPVTMASLTTILGMLPLLNDPMYGSLAVTIMSGLTAGIIITLFLLPSLYAIFFNISKPQIK